LNFTWFILRNKDKKFASAILNSEFISILLNSRTCSPSASTLATIVEEQTTFSEASQASYMEQKNARWVMEPSMNISYIGFSVCLHPVLIVAAVTGTRSANETGIILAVHVD